MGILVYGLKVTLKIFKDVLLVLLGSGRGCNCQVNRCTGPCDPYLGRVLECSVVSVVNNVGKLLNLN